MQHILLRPKNLSDKLGIMVKALKNQANFVEVFDFKKSQFNEGDILVIAADVDIVGNCPEVTRSITEALVHAPKQFYRVSCGFLIASDTAFYTKEFAKRMAFVLNQHGACLNGHALIEAIEDYKNFETWQKSFQLPLAEVCAQRIKTLYQNISEKSQIKRKKVLALHASNRTKSNTYALWSMVKSNLDSRLEVKELHIENGNIVDCKGCAYTTCLHYAKEKECFYGGQVTMELLPAIEEADIIIWVCPNYNDAVSAMHTALINRLTVLYRRISLKHKQIYGIVISANSGCDIVAGQLIGALNFNKRFMVPPKAFLCEIACDPDAVSKIDGIHEKANRFAKQIYENSIL